MKNNTNILSYFLCRCLLLGGGLSLIFLSSGKETYLSTFLGTLLGIAIIYIITKIVHIDSPINDYFRKKNFINISFKVLYFIYLLFVIFILLIILSVFLSSYFLPFTPSLMSCLPFIFLACFLNSKNIKNIVYIALVLMVISIIIILTKTMLLTSEFDITNLFPLLSTKPLDIFKGAGIYAVLTTAPLLCLIDEKVEFKKVSKYYIIASILNIIVFLTITLVMGSMIKVYSYPEYAVLRKIRFFNFIENIENIISISWFFDLFICLLLSSLKIKNIFNTNKRFVPFIIVTLLMIIISIIFSNNYYNLMFIYSIFPYVLLVLMIIIIIYLYIIKKIKKSY